MSHVISEFLHALSVKHRIHFILINDDKAFYERTDQHED